MARTVYDSATLTIGGDSYECSDFAISIQQNTTPDWEAFTKDYVQNAPTTYSWTMTGSSILDSAAGANIATWLPVAGGVANPTPVTVVADTADSGGPIYTGTSNCTISCDIDVSRGDYGKISLSIKGGGALTVTES